MIVIKRLVEQNKGNTHNPTPKEDYLHTYLTSLSTAQSVNVETPFLAANDIPDT